MNDQYDMKEQKKEIFETKGGKAFFNELNAAGIPFFFIAATENTEDKTDYLCETITPSAMGIRLTDDKFADHLNIQHQGFVTVLESQTPHQEVTASELLNAAIKNVSQEQVPVQEQPEDDVPAWVPDPGQYAEEISIVWGTKPLEPAKGSDQDGNTRN